MCVCGYSVDLDVQAVPFNVHGTVQECQTCSSGILTGEFDISIHYVDVFHEGFYFQCSDPDTYVVHISIPVVGSSSYERGQGLGNTGEPMAVVRQRSSSAPNMVRSELCPVPWCVIL